MGVILSTYKSCDDPPSAWYTWIFLLCVKNCGEIHLKSPRIGKFPAENRLSEGILFFFVRASLSQSIFHPESRGKKLPN